MLDAVGTEEQIGKTAGKDEAAGKATVVAVLGVERATAEAQRLSHQAISHLDHFGPEADRLRTLAHWVVSRRS